MSETRAPRTGWNRVWHVAWALVPPALVVLLLALVGYTHRDPVIDAISLVPPWAIAGATAAHLLTLALRTEAWRIVLRGAGASTSMRALHAANAGAFLAGAVQGPAAMPTRISLLRRYGGEESPEVSQIALADAPILLFEVCASAVLAAVASTAVGGVPAWVPWVMLTGAIAVLAALRAGFERFRHRRFAAGLAVLAQPGLRSRLAVAVAAFTLMAFLRTWIVLAAFGLPSDPAHVCLVLFTMGTVGLLPIGVGTGPASMVAALGTTSLATATAAGMVVSTATVLAVLLYAGTCSAWRALVPVPATA
jgi:hypothetical protein